MLLGFIVVYMLGTLAIGYWASRRVKDTRDFVVAGRKLPLMVSSAALFATWFGSETVMGAPAEFLDGGLLGVVEDPLGAALCLFLAGAFIARPLYRLNILTFNDYYRLRYGRTVEIVSALFMVPSYFGWIAAQMVAMAILLNVLLQVPVFWGIQLCLVVTVIYTYVGGMWAVSVTDFVQTVIIIIGVCALAVQVSAEAGGAQAVFAAQPEGFFRAYPQRDFNSWMSYIAAWITLGLGSIPQQDVFQRFMAAKDEDTAALSGYVGGGMYLVVGAIPLYIALCARILHPEMIGGDAEKLLPELALRYSGIGVQVLFFGAILSAILSTTSGAILAPAAVVGENLVKPLFSGKLSDAQLLRSMRIAVIVIAVISALMAHTGAGIYELVGQSSALSLVSLFAPLAAGLYWKRASSVGAMLAMILGMAVWLAFEFVLDSEVPSLIWGLLASTAGMIGGSLLFPSTHALPAMPGAGNPPGGPETPGGGLGTR
jgi:SSS family transporter